MKILLTGASGFLGRHLLSELLRQQEVEKIYCLIHSNNTLQNDNRVMCVNGDISNISELQIEDKIDVCIIASGINNGSKILENQIMSVNYKGVQSCVQFCKYNAVKQIILISSINVRLSIKDDYAISKTLAEKEVTDSGLEYIIFRPALMYGHNCKRGLHVIENAIKKFGVVPVFGNGEKIEQPIFVDECAAFIVNYIVKQRVNNQIVELVGKDGFEYNDLCKTIAKCMNKKVILIHVPVRVVECGLKVLKMFHIKVPISLEQVYHIDSDLSGNMEDVYQLTGILGEDFEINYMKN